MKINQRKDGYYYCSKLYNGKRYQIVGKSKVEVKEKLVNLEYTLRNGIIESKISTKDWCLEWLQTYKRNVAKATYRMYEQVIRLYIIPSIGIIPLAKLKETDIMNMLNSLTERGITRKRDVTLLTIKQILDKAISNDLITKNVAKDIKIKKHIATEKEPISQDVIRKLEEHLDEDCCRMCYFLVYTGLRREELIPLTYEDIVNNTIRVDKAFSEGEIKKTKNEEIRYVPLLSNVNKILAVFGSGLIFFNQYGEKMSETSFRRKIERANKICGCHFTAHQLRHTYACILHKAGVPLKEAQYFMGHKDIKMLLNIYTHSDEEDKKRATDMLESFVKL